MQLIYRQEGKPLFVGTKETIEIAKEYYGEGVEYAEQIPLPKPEPINIMQNKENFRRFINKKR